MRDGATSLPDALYRDLCYREFLMCEMIYCLQLIIEIAFGGDKLHRLKDFPERLIMSENGLSVGWDCEIQKDLQSKLNRPLLSVY